MMIHAGRRVALITFVLWVASGELPAASAESFGKFIGTPRTEWSDDGRTMRLLEDFIYEDARGTRWVAPAGSQVNGASIPRVFWWLIGGPFEGRYRNASIVHDTECHEPYKHDWKAVHRMFHDAVRAGGVDPLKSRVMFAAVYHFGPRWTFDGVEPEAKTLDSEDDALRLRALIHKRPDIGLEELERLTHAALANLISAEEVERQRCEVERERVPAGGRTASTSEGDAGDARTRNLGRLRAGCTYDTVVGVTNICRRRHNFEISVRDAPWFTVPEPVVRRLGAGETAMAKATIDLRGVDGGEHEGRLTVRCRRCRRCKGGSYDLRVSVLPRCPA